MEKTVNITKTLCVGANVMDANIIKTIVRLFRQKYEKTCDEKDGFIVSIENLTDLTNMISKDSCHIHFTATLRAKAIKPEKGMKFSFKPTLLLQKGIFGKVYESISLFIPEEYMKGWAYKGDYFESEDGRKISKDDDIDAVIGEIKFNTTKYNCICRLSV
jgi:DNA-directed RNA polymerase subunit E'/Rpb7